MHLALITRAIFDIPGLKFIRKFLRGGGEYAMSGSDGGTRDFDGLVVGSRLFRSTFLLFSWLTIFSFYVCREGGWFLIYVYDHVMSLVRS